jgi:hypothetical protein
MIEGRRLTGRDEEGDTMNKEEFLRCIEMYVRDSAVKSVMSNLQSPPGQRPRSDLVEASKWFLQQDDSTKKIIQYIAKRAADAATLGFLCAIEGSRAIENPGPSKDSLELFHVSKSGRVLLNDGPFSELFRV